MSVVANLGVEDTYWNENKTILDGPYPSNIGGGLVFECILLIIRLEHLQAL